MRIVFSPHAEDKFKLLAERRFPVSRDKVLECVKKPDTIEKGYKGRRIAQRVLDETHVLRVVFFEEKGTRKIITFYPGRRERYENKL